MLQSLGRKPLYLAGVLGLVAGALVAHRIATAPPALAAEVATAPPAAHGGPGGPGGIVFLDSPRAEDAAGVAHGPGEPAAGAAQAGTRESPGGGILRIVIMLTVLVGGAIAWVVTRRRQQVKGGGGDKALALLGTVRIAGRWQVALVKVPGKTLVLGATEKGLSLLSELDDDVLLETSAPDDELAARIGADEESVSLAPRAPRAARARVATDPLGGAPRIDAAKILGEPFGRLLGGLTASGDTSPPPPVRERLATDEARALRARLERHQTAH